MRTNTRYLTLALTFRRLSNSLIQLADHGTFNQQFVGSLQDLLLSVNERNARASVQSLKERGRFGGYEGVVTLNEVIKPADVDTFTAHIQALISDAELGNKRENALQAIEFFDRLERRALYHHNHPQMERRALAHR